jgi:DNA-binding NarL/FixJ family response regulator
VLPFNVKTAFPELTARQADVFRELMRGLSDKQIARELGVSDTTVKTHVRAILQIVGVHKRGEAAFEARARGVSER